MPDRPDPFERCARADEIFDRALDLPEDERVAFLTRACGEDEEVLVLVRRLLRASQETGDLLDTAEGLPRLGESVSRPGEMPSEALSVGQSLSHYRIVDQLGRGGMGEVYEATDTRLERTVALKVLPSEAAADSGALDRFRQEARSLAKLNHPNIVTLHSVEEADGLHFLTMERIEGPRVPSSRTHGTGCTFASAIAAGLARSRGVVEAVVEAKQYVREALEAAFAVGQGGVVLSHFCRSWERE